MNNPSPDHKPDQLSSQESELNTQSDAIDAVHNESVLPDDLQPLADQLTAFGQAQRDQGEALAARIAEATMPILAQQPPPLQIHQRARTWNRLLLFSAPLAAAAITLVIYNLPQAAPTTTPTPGSGAGVGTGGTVQAANLDAQIDAQVDAWANLDAMWSADLFEAELTSLTLDAAALGSQDTFSIDDSPFSDSVLSGTDS